MKNKILIDGVSAEVEWKDILDQAIVERGLVQVILDIADTLKQRSGKFFCAGQEVYSNGDLEKARRRIERHALSLRSLNWYASDE